MLIGYASVSKADGSQSLDLQRDALQAAGVDAGHQAHSPTKWAIREADRSRDDLALVSVVFNVSHV